MSKSKELLQDFSAYCEQHPEERFWQALRNWSGVSFVHVTERSGDMPKDTYYFEGKVS
jgi:hypothetical protein